MMRRRVGHAAVVLGLAILALSRAASGQDIPLPDLSEAQPQVRDKILASLD